MFGREPRGSSNGALCLFLGLDSGLLLGRSAIRGRLDRCRRNPARHRMESAELLGRCALLVQLVLCGQMDWRRLSDISRLASLVRQGRRSSDRRRARRTVAVAVTTCPFAIEECKTVTPLLRDIGPGRLVACHVATADDEEQAPVGAAGSTL